MDKGLFAKRLRAARLRLGLTQAELAALAQTNRGALNNWERGKSFPEVAQLIRLHKALGVTTDWLLGVEPEHDKRAVLEEARREKDRLEKELETCEPRRRRWVLDALVRVKRKISFLEEVLQQQERPPMKRREAFKTIPLVGTIAAGRPVYAEENIEGEVVLPFAIRADYALRVRGESMAGKGIFDGDIAICRKPTGDVPYRRLVVALVDGTDATLKLLTKKGNKWVLRAAHPDYPDIVINPNTDVIQGVVVMILRDLDFEWDPDDWPLFEVMSAETGVPAPALKAFFAAFAAMKRSREGG